MSDKQELVRKLRATPIGYIVRLTTPSGRVCFLRNRYWAHLIEPWLPVIGDAQVWKTATGAHRQVDRLSRLFVRVPGYSFQVTPVFSDPRVTGMQSIVA
jgi:hypothetical protein